MARPPARDLGLAAVLAVAVLAGTTLAATIQPTARPVGVVTVVAVLVAAAACAWRREAPLVAAGATALTVAGYVVAGQPYGPIQLLVALTCFEAARRRPTGAAARLAAGAGVVLSAALSTRLGGSPPLAVGIVLLAWPAVFVVIPALAGALVRARVFAVARERAELLARGAAEERLRVAREVHDVAGHGFAVVAMQAGVALTVFDEDPAQARISLEAIRNSAEHALGELHRTLETLRPDHSDVADARDVGPLIDRVRAAGVPVDLRVTGGPERVGDGVSTVVHRIVQEALTNVIRHAGPTRATVAITYGPGPAVAVAVRDNGTGAVATGHAGGSGLDGLRARVEQLGGSFRAGGCADGGFEVVAHLPGAPL